MKSQRSKILKINMKPVKIGLVAVGLTMGMVMPSAVSAQDSKTFGDALAVPVFEQVDANGVDLINGYLRIQSPTIVRGTDQHPVVTGLQWTGRGWTHIDVPSLWKDNGVYTVNYKGRSEEFKNYTNNYAQKKPISGAELSCSVFQPSNLTSRCLYRSRDGDVLVFFGIPTPQTPTPNNIGQLGYKFGNLAMTGVQRYSDDRRDRTYDTITWPVYDDIYYKQTVYIWDDRHSNLGYSAGALKIVTPNHNDDKDEHYLRPKGTTQTITDNVGSQWRYTVNNDRELTRIQSPGGAADVTYSYNGSHRVVSATTADGTWTYSYTTPGSFRTVTRTDPDGRQIYVKSHRDRGHVVETRDELNRITYYTYDNGYRLQKITYPEGNRLEFTYDARGNVLTKKQIGKTGQVFTETAIYPSSCQVSPTCNKPTAIIDANGNRTDFEYQTPRDRSILGLVGLGTAKAGPGSPTKITLPSPGPGLARPQIRNVYANESGLLIESSICKTGSSCSGTNDEVKTTYDYKGTEFTSRRLYEMAVTSGGETLRTCYGYDISGRRISETPPRANLSTCPDGVTSVLPASRFTPASNPRTTPTYPGVAGGGTPPGGGGSGGGGSGGPPGEEDCGTGGQVCN